MKKLYFSLSLFLCWQVGVLAQVIDADLDRKIQVHPEKEFSIIVFFPELSPQTVLDEQAIRGDKHQQVQQVVSVFRQKVQEASHWVEQYQSRNSSLKNYRVHELVQAASCQATGSIIRELAQQSQVSRIDLYQKELLKPDEFFLTDAYYEFHIDQVQSIGEEEVSPWEISPEKYDDGSSIDLDKIINTLKKVYDFIKDNKQVVNHTVDMASAIPSGVKSWQSMAGWEKKTSSLYRVTFKNGFGMEVVAISLRVHFNYNGNYEGKGKYITCATASINELSVLWGYTVNAKVEIPDTSIVNKGTSTDPVAGMQMFLSYTIETIVKFYKGGLNYSLDGRGNLEES